DGRWPSGRVRLFAKSWGKGTVAKSWGKGTVAKSWGKGTGRLLVLERTRKISSSSQLATDIVAVQPGGLKDRLVTTEALSQREFYVAFEPRPRRRKMIFTGSLARSQDSCPRARDPCLLIDEQCLVEITGVVRDRG